MPIETLKGALHTHTTCSDGSQTPEEVVKTYQDLGFDFIALTDHDLQSEPGCHDNMPESANGMLIFRGVETTVLENEYFHIGHVIGDKEELYVFNHPALYGLSLETIIERLKNIAQRVPIDAVEISLNGYYTPEFNVRAIPYLKIASDDCHEQFDCGRAWVEVRAEREKDAILRAIKEGEYQVVFRNPAERYG